MRIALRADGGPSVGLGHLGRCAAVAQGLRARGARPVFVEVPPSCRGWIRRCGFPMGRLADGRWDLLVADGYRFTRDDWRKMRGAAGELAVVDDHGRHPGPADWVINGSAYGRSLRFRARGAKRIVGARFMPMRREYWRACAARPVRAAVRSVVVALGGGDSRGLAAAAALACAAALPGVRVRLVVGPLARVPSRLPASVRVVRSPRSLKPLLLRCDAGICAGGQTLYELAATGTPALALELGPDQKLNIRALSRAGAALPLGKPDRGWSARLARALSGLTPAKRRAMAAAGRRITDGRGALRVADALLESRR